MKKKLKKIIFKANPISVRKISIILWCLVKKSVKTQYRRSFLGILWTVLNPLLNMFVMSFVFSHIFGRNGIGMDYPVYVLSGNIVFGLMRASTTTAMPSLVNNYDLITKTRTPYAVFPLSNVFTALVNFGFSLIALIIVMIVRIPAGVRFYWSGLLIFLPWLPAIMLFSAGISFFLSVVYVRFRDIKHIYTVFLTLWMYLTPVFYSVETLKLPEKYATLMKLNPMYQYLKYFRDALSGVVPSASTTLICYGVGIVVFVLGLSVFKLLRKKTVFYI